MKLFVRIALNTLLGIALIFVWTRFVDLESILQILKTTDVKIALIFFVFFLASTFFRSFRLKLLLPTKIHIKNIYFLNLLSQFLSFMIPLRLGEVAKSAYLSTHYNLPLAKTVVWIFLDRFLDFWVVIMLINILILTERTKLPASFGLISFGVLLLFTVAYIVLITSPKLFKKMVYFLSRFLIFEKLKKFFLNFSEEIIDGFSILRRHPLEMAQLIGLSVLAIISDALIWFILFKSLSIDFSVFRSILGNCIYTLSFLIPAAPGYVGSAEASGLAVFSGILGINADSASAAIVLNHILTIVALPVFGILAIYILKFDLKMVWSKFKKQEEK